MPVNQSLMAALKKRYGDEKGETIYYKMESEGKVHMRGSTEVTRPVKKKVARFHKRK